MDKTTNIDTLSADIVRKFIGKIIVCHREEKDGITTQKVEIYYNVIGKFELPQNYKLETANNLYRKEEKSLIRF